MLMRTVSPASLRSAVDPLVRRAHPPPFPAALLHCGGVNAPRVSPYAGRVKDFWLYTLARFGIFAALLAVAMLVFWLANGREGVWIVWPVLTAAVTSSIISTYALRGMRDKVAANVQARAARATARMEEMRAREDAEDDARRAEESQGH